MNKLRDVKDMATDRAKVVEWLSTNEPDEESRKEVIELCTKNVEYRKWFVETYCK